MDDLFFSSDPSFSIDENEGKQAPLTEDELLEQKYSDAKARYYRHVLRKQDEDVLKKILKIPDNWKADSGKAGARYLELPDYKKKRLSDIKAAKSWELKFESLFVFFLINVEHILHSCLNYHTISAAQIDEALDSANSVLVEIGGNLANFKYLLLSIAKRSISDLYYLMSSHTRFFKKKNFDFETDFGAFFRDCIAIFDGYGRLNKEIALFTDYKNIIDPFFAKSPIAMGWRLDEFALKKFLEKSGSAGLIPVDNLEKIVTTAFVIKKKIKADHDFLSYYYNPKDGKLYRYGFILASMAQKLAEGRISRPMYEGFEQIQSSFIALNQNFERQGLEGFGPSGMRYRDLLEFIYKCCKIIEYNHLRASRYESLQNLRSEILHFVENELQRFNAVNDKLG